VSTVGSEGRASDTADAGRAHRSGVIAILGRPNAGKSTLLNRLLGQKLAIVTRKPQTTRSRILGIVTRPDAQLLLLDTPGFHESEKPLNQLLNTVVDEAARDCDLALLLIDPRAGCDEGHRSLCAALVARGVPVVVAATQIDRPAAAKAPWPPQLDGVRDFPKISARTGAGIEALLDALAAALPVGPRFYAEDEITDRPVRFFAAELIREAAFEALSEEVPYSIAVDIRSFDESDPEMIRIHADLLVERSSQKAIVLGRGGARIKQIGTAARRELEALLEARVYPELFVRCEPHWARKKSRVRALGYH
jgi:GTP-binding protein Era